MLKNSKALGYKQVIILQMLKVEGALTVLQIVNNLGYARSYGLDYVRVHALVSRGLIKRTSAKVQTYVLA